MTNKLCHKDVLNPHVLLSVVVLVWLKTTTAATSLGIDKCIDKEREALVDFRAHLKEDHYGHLFTWKPEDEDCCKWSGVTCNNHTGHIIRLSLSQYNLVGEVSPSLLNLTYLNLLDLSYNSFDGTIPMSIGSLTELRYLNLSGNSFTDTIPSSIGSLTELRHLDLSGNSFTGTIPRSVGSLAELRHLDLSGNSFTGTIPRSICSLTELTYLDLSRNSLLNGTIPTELGNLTNLEHLSLKSLESCTIENLDWLSHVSQLQHLHMDGISLAKAEHWVNVILSLHRLSELSLSGCDLSQVMHPYSSSLNSSSSSSIVDLDLGDNNLNSSMYHWFFPLTSNKLQTLDLSDNKLDGIPKYLGNLCSLESLNLYNNSLVGEFPDFLNNLSGCISATLQVLQASFNQITGSLPDEIQMFSSLEYLDLHHNKLNGNVSEKVWELPKLYGLDVSFNSMYIDLSNIGTSKLRYIYLSNTSLQGIPPQAHMSNLSYLEFIDLSSCKQLGPHFPTWIQSLKNLTHLSIANTGISGTIPLEFWNMWPSQLAYLNLSSNNITGMVPDLISNFGPEFSIIDLSSNNFYGLIPDVSSALASLDLSRNKFSGGISFLCNITGGYLSYLDLSNNALTGKIPDCLWIFKELKVLNLEYNNFFGSLPPSVESLITLEVLYINNNNFSGELPLSLRNCTNLNFLDMSNNRFSGSVPFWIGENLSALYVFSLASNKFCGTIPLQLCQLVKLQVLDLSKNDISGTIPSCVSNLAAMVQDEFSTNRNEHFIYTWSRPNNSFIVQHIHDHAMIKWLGSAREFTSNLGSMKSIDLSSNNLTGQIPNELTNLQQLISLNLSNNALHGKIPQHIGLMKNLQALDLSRNNLSEGIPLSISQMTFLSYLDVSYNNLSGRIPLSTQLQSFEPSKYTGNAGLCGLPLTKFCPGDKLEVPRVTGKTEDDGESTDTLERWFYIGGTTGFAIGFWVACSALLLNRQGRHGFFWFMDGLEDWVYVKVVVFIAKLQRVAHT